MTKAKRTKIERRIAADPAASDRALAREFGIDNKTVAAIRKGLGHEEIPRPKPVRRERKELPVNDGPAAPVANTTPKLAQLEPVSDPPVDDPIRILREIAADPNAPATARVQAAKALLAMQKPTATEKAAAAEDKVTARALALIVGGKQ